MSGVRLGLGLFFRGTLVVAVAVLAIGVVDWRQFVDHLSWGHAWVILAVQPIQFLGIGLTALRFHSLLGRPVARALVFRAYILSVGLHVLLPGRLSELLKVTMLRDRGGVPASAGLAALVLERIVDLLFLGIFLLLGIGAMLVELHPAFVAASIIALLVTVQLLPWLEPMLAATIRRLPLRSLGGFLRRGLGEAAARVREGRMAGVLGLSALAWLSSFALVAAVLKMLGDTRLDTAAMLTVFTALAVGRAIPGLPAGLGTFEAAVVVALRKFGYGFEEALAVALTTHAAQLVGVHVVALGVLAREGTGLASLLSHLRSLPPQVDNDAT